MFCDVYHVYLSNDADDMACVVDVFLIDDDEDNIHSGILCLSCVNRTGVCLC